MSQGIIELLQTRLERAAHGSGNQITLCAPLYWVILSYKAHKELEKSKIPPSITSYN
jgi:hypothetical protein